MDTNNLEPTRGGKTSSHQVHQCICPLIGLVHRNSASACLEVVDREWSCWSLTLAVVYGHYISPTRTQAHGETPPRVNRSPLSQARTGGVREKSLLRWRLWPLHWHGVSVRADTAIPQRCRWVKKVLSHLWGKRREMFLCLTETMGHFSVGAAAILPLPQWHCHLIPAACNPVSWLKEARNHRFANKFHDDPHRGTLPG